MPHLGIPLVLFVYCVFLSSYILGGVFVVLSLSRTRYVSTSFVSYLDSLAIFCFLCLPVTTEFVRRICPLIG